MAKRKEQPNQASAGTIDHREVPMSLVEPNPWNPNKQTDRQFQAETESILMYGMIDPITVRPHPDNDTNPGEPPRFQILDGEHRWRAMTQLARQGLPPAAHPALVRLITEGLIPANVVPMSDAWARKFTVIANETRGSADQQELSKLLADLSKDMSADELLLGLPYGADELEELIAMGGFDFDAFAAGKEPPERDEDFHTFKVAIPKDAYEVVQQARAAITQEHKLHEKETVAWGQILEMLAADYLAGARGTIAPDTHQQ